tara:strand:- start:76 stop:624 length:549 start_codon:yes stop_codon:yes gene_type:complete
MTRYITSLFLLGLTSLPCAANDDFDFSLFAKSEFNALDDHIVSTGFEVLGYFNHTPFGIGFISALGNASVTTEQGYREDFLTLDTGLKFGYFSTIYAYGELGFDAFELMFHDQRNNDRYSNHSSITVYNAPNNEIDAYLGAGIGVQIEHLKLEAYTRYRQIDGNGWEAKDNHFTGLQLSFSF